ncbi:MAG: DUF1905 domain-containing protein [Gemmatimonadetes bacterium]|nr:DUF1905 domain-containing protein [Gemmatimonadota bacterium]MCH7565106.1 DUF1905 domain-containing protein [Gemmatimonadota bacterium]
MDSSTQGGPASGPSVTEGWGRTPVVATVDGHTWKTSAGLDWIH